MTKVTPLICRNEAQVKAFYPLFHGDTGKKGRSPAKLTPFGRAPTEWHVHPTAYYWSGVDSTGEYRDSKARLMSSMLFSTQGVNSSGV